MTSRNSVKTVHVCQIAKGKAAGMDLWPSLGVVTGTPIYILYRTSLIESQAGQVPAFSPFLNHSYIANDLACHVFCLLQKMAF